MAPPPLKPFDATSLGLYTTITPTPRHLLSNGTIATAASPLQSSFHLSCRSPGSRLWRMSQPSPGLPLVPTENDLRRQDAGKLGMASTINIIVGKTIGASVFSVPSAVFEGVGSVGMSMLVWALGSLISFCGMAVYLDLGTAMPRSGGERVYLERIFRRPRMLATCMFMTYVVLLGFSAPDAIVLGEYALYAADVSPSRWNARIIAVVSVSFFCCIHARLPRLGLGFINVLGVAKILFLLVMVVAGTTGGLLGVASDHSAHNGSSDKHVLMGHHMDADMIGHMPGAARTTSMSIAQRNFQDIWADTSSQPYDYATALLKVIYCFRGYSTANQVLSDVKNPVRTLRVAVPGALTLVSVVYMAVNLSFFLAVDKEDFRTQGVLAAGVLFRNVFGQVAGTHVLPLCVIISAAGSIAATTFAQARVNEELAKDGLLPMSGFWKSHGRTPSRGLLLHWVVSVAVIVLPPPGKIYNFLVDIGGYPVSVISMAVAAGLLYLQCAPSERWVSPWPAPRFAIVVFAIGNFLLLLPPWIPPTDLRGESGRFANYAYPATAVAVLASGVLYWCWWRWRDSGNGKGEAAMTEVEVADSGNGVTGRSRSSRKSQDRLDEPDHTYRAMNGMLPSDDGMRESSSLIGHSPTLRQRAPCGCPVMH